MQADLKRMRAAGCAPIMVALRLPALSGSGPRDPRRPAGFPRRRTDYVAESVRRVRGGLPARSTAIRQAGAVVEAVDWYWWPRSPTARRGPPRPKLARTGLARRASRHAQGLFPGARRLCRQRRHRAAARLAAGEAIAGPAIIEEAEAHDGRAARRRGRRQSTRAISSSRWLGDRTCRNDSQSSIRSRCP